MRHPIYRILSILAILLSATYLFASISISEITQPTTGEQNGEVCVQAIGDAGPFEIMITGPGDYSLTADNIRGEYCFDNLGEGEYLIVVTDDKGCIETMRAELFSTCPLRVEVEDVQDVTACVSPECEEYVDTHVPSGSDCTNDGSITLNVTGASNYTVVWTSIGGYSNTGETITGLSEGLYMYTVTHDDIPGCILTGEVVVSVCTRANSVNNGGESDCVIDYKTNFIFDYSFSSVTAVYASDGTLFVSANQPFNYMLFSSCFNFKYCKVVLFA